MRLWRPNCTLIRTPSHSLCFEHAKSVHHRSGFYAIPQRLLAMPLHCCGDAWDGTVRTSILSILHFSWTPWDWHPGQNNCRVLRKKSGLIIHVTHRLTEVNHMNYYSLLLSIVLFSKISLGIVFLAIIF